jgi:hypothetical protein
MSARSLQLATQQGTAPDRLQPALRSFLPSLRLPAVGELGRYADHFWSNIQIWKIMRKESFYTHS